MGCKKEQEIETLPSIAPHPKKGRLPQGPWQTVAPAALRPSWELETEGRKEGSSLLCGLDTLVGKTDINRVKQTTKKLTRKQDNVSYCSALLEEKRWQMGSFCWGNLKKGGSWKWYFG